MATRVASLYAELKADTTQLESRLKAVEGRLQKTDKQATTLKDSLGKIAGTATGLAVAVGTFKKALDLARQGAEMERTREKFDRLAATYGTTGDALMNRLRPAMQGLVSDQEGIASATDIMSLHLVNSQKDVVRLANVSSQLGFDMNQLVLTLSNMTTMRFDSLGLQVTGFQDKVDALKASGMSAADAFREAFLQQAEDQLRKVGSVADSDVAVFMKFDAQVKNMEDSVKLFLARGLVPWIEIMQNAPTFIQGTSDALTAWLNATANGTDFQTEFNKVLQDTWDRMDELKRQEELVAVASANTSGEFHGMERSFKAVGDAADSNIARIRDVNHAFRNIGENVKASSAATGSFKRMIHELATSSVGDAALIAAWNTAIADGIITPGEVEGLKATAEAFGVQLPSDLQKAVDKTNDLADLNNKMSSTHAVLLALSAHKWDIDVEVHQTGGLGSGVIGLVGGGKRTGTHPGGGGAQEGFQHGGSMIVPPGFPNDTFNIGVSSGEHVAVTPAAEAGPGGGGGMTVNINGPLLIQANNPRQLGDQLGLLARRT